MQKKIRIFLSKRLEENKNITLDKKQSHYITNVMRLIRGDNLLLFNGIDGEFLGEVSEIKKKIISIQVKKKQRDQTKASNISLAFCPIKGQRMDLLVQKCTELGLKSFIPVISDHTIVRKINKNRLIKIIIESCEQSNQLSVPLIAEPLHLENFVYSLKSEDKVLFADINHKKNNLKKILEDRKKNHILFIGPEGDFSSKEKCLILKNDKFNSFSLGKNILRSETAAISGLVLLNFFLY